jgi:hypothetical protein
MARNPRYHPNYQTAVTQLVTAADAKRLLGTGLKCQGIHLPDDPSPSTLSGRVAEFWHAAYENANRYYNPDNDPDAEKTAKKTAWKSTRLFFRKTVGGWRLAPAIPPPGQGPSSFIGNPGDLTQLGVCIEYTYIDGDANLQIRRFPKQDPPYLYWSSVHRTCYVFPGMKPGKCEAPDPWSTAGREFKRWAQRDPECSRVIDVPEVSLQLMGLFDTVVYGSDKWHDPNPDDRMVGSQEYIHQVGDGVGLWQAQGAVPPAIAFTGGCMDMEERGLIH